MHITVLIGRTGDGHLSPSSARVDSLFDKKMEITKLGTFMAFLSLCLALSSVSAAQFLSDFWKSFLPDTMVGTVNITKLVSSKLIVKDLGGGKKLSYRAFPAEEDSVNSVFFIANYFDAHDPFFANVDGRGIWHTSAVSSALKGKKELVYHLIPKDRATPMKLVVTALKTPRNGFLDFSPLYAIDDTKWHACGNLVKDAFAKEGMGCLKSDRLASLVKTLSDEMKAKGAILITTVSDKTTKAGNTEIKVYDLVPSMKLKELNFYVAVHRIDHIFKLFDVHTKLPVMALDFQISDKPILTPQSDEFVDKRQWFSNVNDYTTYLMVANVLNGKEVKAIFRVIIRTPKQYSRDEVNVLFKKMVGVVSANPDPRNAAELWLAGLTERNDNASKLFSSFRGRILVYRLNNRSPLKKE